VKLRKDGSVSFSASFDPDDPTLIDRYPDYTSETDPGERPPTPTQQRGKKSMRKASKKKKIMSAIPLLWKKQVSLSHSIK
jgi:hypothetical protein